jgi:hypothetical protein
MIISKRPYQKIYLQVKIGSYPSSGSSFCLVLPCVVVFVTTLRAFRYCRSRVSLRLFVHLGAHLANWSCISFGCPSCQLALPCPWLPNLGQSPHVFCYGSSCVWVPMLRSRLALHWDTHLLNSPYVVFEPPTLVRAY